MAGHVAPEAARGGPIARVRDGDIDHASTSTARTLQRRRLDDAELAERGWQHWPARRRQRVHDRRDGEVRAAGVVGGAGSGHDERCIAAARVEDSTCGLSSQAADEHERPARRSSGNAWCAKGVTDVFGYPGGAILPAYDAMLDYPIRHVLVRHEQGATHMADGYARASGKVGVAIATSGPGATNMVTGIATAMMDSSPIVCITGQVGSKLIGSDAFQETDITGVTLPITKHNYLVTRARGRRAGDPRGVPHRARAAAPGRCWSTSPRTRSRRRASSTGTRRRRSRTLGPERGRSTRRRSRGALELINAARAAADPRRPRHHAVRRRRQSSGSSPSARRFPVAMTLLGLGGFPASHPLNLGMMGMHGEAWVNTAIQEADLLLAFGMRFDDRVTGNLKTYAPNAQEDPHRHRPGGDQQERHGRRRHRRRPARRARGTGCRGVAAGRSQRVARAHRRAQGRLGGPRHPEPARRRPSLRRARHPRPLAHHRRATRIVVTDVGQHQMWEAQYYHHDKPRTLITSGGLGTMGFALPAAIGAKFACPDAEVWVIAGDGGFQMTMPELATIAQEELDINVAIINNGYLGMVRQWQEFFYERRYAATPLLSPDFVKLAEALRPAGDAVTERGRGRAGGRAARAHQGHGADRLPGRAGRHGLSDGAGRRRPARDDPAARRRALRRDRGGSRENDMPHTFVVVRRGQARRAESRGVAVPAPRLQHRVADRRPHRGRASRA